MEESKTKTYKCFVEWLCTNYHASRKGTRCHCGDIVRLNVRMRSLWIECGTMSLILIVSQKKKKKKKPWKATWCFYYSCSCFCKECTRLILYLCELLSSSVVSSVRLCLRSWVFLLPACQVMGSVEAFATAGKLVLARPIGDMDLLDVRAQVG